MPFSACASPQAEQALHPLRTTEHAMQKYPKHADGQHCGIFAGKQVTTAGWCRARSEKT
jgi:hypothetical protein